MNEDILYTPDEIAKQLRITKNTVYEMIKRGDLNAHRIGKHLRISSSQFKLYLLKSNDYKNVYEGKIKHEADETFAVIDKIKIYVNTELDGDVKISIPSEDIILSKDTFISSARNLHKGMVTDILFDNNSAKVSLDIGIPLISTITRKSLNEMNITKGMELYAIFKTMSVKTYK